MYRIGIFIDELCSPRVILVSHEGQLVGLVTVKDVLKHEAAHIHREANSIPAIPAPGRGTRRGGVGHGYTSSDVSDVWAESWAAIEEDERGHGLEIALQEGYAWVRVRGSRLYNVFHGFLRQVRGGESRGTAGGGFGSGRDPGFEYELEDDRPGVSITR